jgi:hypothetical protein
MTAIDNNQLEIFSERSLPQLVNVFCKPRGQIMQGKEPVPPVEAMQTSLSNLANKLGATSIECDEILDLIRQRKDELNHSVEEAHKKNRARKGLSTD